MRIQTENIYQVIEVNAAPAEVYKVFTDEKLHAEFTGKATSLELKEGGEFSFCNGNHTGYFLKLIQNKTLVLVWTHKKFPRNYYSTVHLQLEKCDHGTRISMNHIGVPTSCDGWLAEAWHKTYWEPLAAYFEPVAS